MKAKSSSSKNRIAAKAQHMYLRNSPKDFLNLTKVHKTSNTRIYG